MPARKHVLIVEDHELMRTELVRIFTDELGYHADAVGSTNEALTLLERGAYDLVFSDNNFPKFAGRGEEPAANQGIEIQLWMKFEQKYQHTPFILHSAAEDVAYLKARVERQGGLFISKGQLSPSIGEVV